MRYYAFQSGMPIGVIKSGYVMFNAGPDGAFDLDEAAAAIIKNMGITLVPLQKPKKPSNISDIPKPVSPASTKGVGHGEQ